MRTLRVYIAHPYSADTEALRLANVERAITFGRWVMDMGHDPFIPQLSHFVDPQNDKYDWERWMDWCLHWVSACDVLLLLGDSRGTRIEAEVMLKMGKPVCRSIEEFETYLAFFEEEE